MSQTTVYSQVIGSLLEKVEKLDVHNVANASRGPIVIVQNAELISVNGESFIAKKNLAHRRREIYQNHSCRQLASRALHYVGRISESASQKCDYINYSPSHKYKQCVSKKQALLAVN